MISKAYRATRIKDVDWDRLARGHEGLDITLGIDVGKHDLWPVCRWADGRFERPWRSPELRGDPQLARPDPADERGPEVGGGLGVVGDLWRCPAASPGRRRTRSSV